MDSGVSHTGGPVVSLYHSCTWPGVYCNEMYYKRIRYGGVMVASMIAAHCLDIIITQTTTLNSAQYAVASSSDVTATLSIQMTLGFQSEVIHRNRNNMRKGPCQA